LIDIDEIQLKEHCPNVASIIKKAGNNISTRLAAYGAGATLRGIDEAIGYLREAESTYVNNSGVSLLVSRAIAQLETGIFAFLTGFHAVMFDSMRCVMEVEFLLRDFLLWPRHQDEWLNLESKMRRKKFSPVKLRDRYKKWLGPDEVDMEEAKDYALHSEFLHVSPIENPSGIGVSSDSNICDLRICLAEITRHTGRIIVLIHRHTHEIPLNVKLTRESAPELPLFEDAWSRAELGVAMWCQTI